MPFRYLRDPLFLACVVLYFANRWLLKPQFHHGWFGNFVHGSLNDVICIPFWVPIMVWLLHILHLRGTNAPPTATEILVPLIMWSWYFELILPRVPYFRHLAFCDPSDILCYAVGALIAAVFWQWYYGRGQIVDDSRANLAA